MNKNFEIVKDGPTNFLEKEVFSNDTEIIPPATDLFFSDDIEHSSLPSEIKSSPEVKKETFLRKELINCLDNLFEKIPVKKDVTEAFRENLITKEELAVFYQKLSEFLQFDENNSRLILYLPFELIPTVDTDNTTEEIKFLNCYLDNWYCLLSEQQDVRANFVDGNILEPELRDGLPPRVCKAAHLIPELVSKGLISVNEVIRLLHYNNEVLHQSILEAIPVLVDLGLIDRKLFKEINNRFPMKLSEKEIKEEAKRLDLEILIKEFNMNLERINNEYALKEKSKSHLKSRWSWEKEEKIKNLISKNAQFLATIIENDPEKFKSIPEDDKTLSLLTIEAIHLAIENIKTKDLKYAQVLSHQFEPYLLKQWQKSSPDIKNQIISTLSHWENQNIISDDYRKKFGFEIPKLDSLSEEQSARILDEVKKISPILEQFESSPELKRAIYPVFILFGSWLKGYTLSSADLDLALFIKPDYKFEKRDQLLKELNRVLASYKNISKPTEFWLKEKDGQFDIKNVPLIDNAIAEQDWVYILMQGIWCGEKAEMSDLYQKLLSTSFKKQKQERFHGVDNRKIWLRGIEREVLQYRLMHKGYARYYPRQGGIQTKHSDLIDSKSDFWDPGFRRVATKLFLKKVFMPSLEK